MDYFVILDICFLHLVYLLIRYLSILDILRFPSFNNLNVFRRSTMNLLSYVGSDVQHVSSVQKLTFVWMPGMRSLHTSAALTCSTAVQCSVLHNELINNR